ncbi:Ejaculatory bulb-specific protein 3 [Frankliniella fusca]|uniref:Ejaculatory bulb-specific protein 3 n=1 Tax=Frankliniella fusca TaxID=407009 RepID=A0AAE1LPP4_9NEOP|nr:Ejaculatory bulb-specific protein 3 [Frankliniella fusca]
MAVCKVLCLALAALVAAAVAQQDETKTYTTKYDNIDLEEILRSERLLKNYFNCLMDAGPCTPDGTELKKTVPDALQNKCAACTPKQQAGSERVIRFLIEKYPEQFLKLEKKYDPTGVYRKEYQAEAEKRGLKLPAPL